MNRKFLAAAALIAACVASPTMAGKSDDTLNVAFKSEITTLDYYKITEREGYTIGRLIFDGLVYKDNATGRFEPLLAESYKIVNDTTIDFELRQGVRFHDGSTMTADDVVYTLNMVSKKEFGARFQLSVQWIDRAEKLGEYSVRLHSKYPYPMAMEMLSVLVPIYPKKYYERVGAAGMATKPVGAGPYRLVSLEPGTRFVLKRFDDYYADSPKGRPAIENIVVRVLPEVNTQYAELMNGKLDWIWRVPPDTIRSLARNPRIQVQSTGIMRFAFMALNPHFGDDKSPLADVRVRRALNYAIDKQAIVKSLVGGASVPIDAACNPMQFGCAKDISRYPYNPERARKLLAAAGYKDGFSLEITGALIPRAQYEALLAQLGAVGVRATVNEQQYAPAMTAWRADKSPVLLGSWGSYGVGDCGFSTDIWFSGTSDDRWKDARVQGALKAASSSLDQGLRKRKFAEAQEIIADQAYWVPLWTYNVNTAQNKDLDFALSPDEFAEFYRAKWK
jgi:peptide/nickel transport system substrate-binding protein